MILFHFPLTGYILAVFFLSREECSQYKEKCFVDPYMRDDVFDTVFIEYEICKTIYFMNSWYYSGIIRNCNCGKEFVLGARIIQATCVSIW